MEDKHTLIDLVKTLHESYEENDEYRNRINDEFADVIKNDKGEKILDISFKNGNSGKYNSLSKVNILFDNRYNQYGIEINKHLNHKVTNRTDGFFVIIRRLNENKMFIQLGQGMNFYTSAQYIYINGFNGIDVTDDLSIEISNKIESMENYLFEEAKKILRRQIKNKKLINDIDNTKIASYVDYNISNKELCYKIDILKRIIACYPDIMEHYMNRVDLKELRTKYENIYDYINEIRQKEGEKKNKKTQKQKSGRTFTVFCWMYMEKEIGIKWKYKKELTEMIKNTIYSNETNDHFENITQHNIEQSNSAYPQEYTDTNNLFFEEVKGKNYIYHGVPGSGKSYFIKHFLLKNIDENNYERIVFYPEYSYTDFVGTYKLKRNEKGNQTELKPVPGPFTRILTKAIINYNEQYVLVIEEMNRGNAEAILGDVFQILDRKDDTYKVNNYFIIDCINEEIEKLNKEKNKKLKKLNNDYKITMPSNLTILATINTTDQNVFNLDTAFGRRWDYVYVTDNFLKDNNAETEESRIFDDYYIKGFNTKWENFRTTINYTILHSDNIWNREDKQLGKFYISKEMLSENADSSLLEDSYINNKIREKFLNKVLRYLWGDVFKADHSELIPDENIVSFGSLVEKFKRNAESLNELLSSLEQYNSI